MFLNNRYMDPQTGVFLSVDPLVAKTGEAYLYAAGNPTTLSDPNGLEPGCGVTAAKAGKGACAAAHQSADLLGTAAVIRHSGDASAGPINSWFQTCTVIYSSCLDGTVDRTGGWGYDDPLGREISANFRLAMWMLGTLMELGLATVDGSGALIDSNGNLFTPTAWLDDAGSLVAAPDGPPGGGLNFTLGVSSGFCIFFCLEVGISGNGLYARPGVGFAVDTPSIVLDNKNPQCGTEASFAYASVGIGPAQAGGGWTSAGRSGDWESYGNVGIALPDGGATPHYKAVSFGAGVTHLWSFC